MKTVDGRRETVDGKQKRKTREVFVLPFTVCRFLSSSFQIFPLALLGCWVSGQLGVYKNEIR